MTGSNQLQTGYDHNWLRPVFTGSVRFFESLSKMLTSLGSGYWDQGPKTRPDRTLKH